MGESACKSYVTWYNRITGNWATWEPGAPVEPGDVGRFDSQLRFRSDRSLLTHGIDFRIGEKPASGAVFLFSEDDAHLGDKVSAQSAAALAFVGHLDGRIKITANRKHACVLHMRGLSDAWIIDLEPIKFAIRGALLAGNWEVDQVVVVRRIKVEKGFAAVSREAGVAFEVKAVGKADFAGLADLVGTEFEFTAGRGSNDFYRFEFPPGATPVFSETIRVKRGLWDKLLPWRHDRGVLIGPDGSRYQGPPSDLSKYLPEDRLFDPARSAMSSEELAAIPVEDLFEEVDALPADVDTNLEPAEGWPAQVISFPLPIPAEPAALAAADPESAAPLLRASSPDGLADLFLHRRGDGEYWLEVSLAPGAPAPAVVAVRYPTVGGGQQELLIPVADDGTRMPSSVVELRGYVRGDWEATVPVPPDRIRWWAPDVVTASVHAAVTAATVRAWKHLLPAVTQDIGLLVHRALEEDGWE